MSTRTALRSVDRARRKHTRALTKWIFNRIGHSPYLEPARLPASEVKRILVVRNNKRIGNMYFMLPFVREVQATYPDAQVDLMVLSEGQASVFQHLGLNNVLVSKFAFASAWSFLRTLFRTRQQVYDLLYMPHSSSSDTLICAFLNARNKVAFWGEETESVFPHAVRAEPESPHAALSALTLLRDRGRHAHHAHHVDHTMVFSEAEIQAGMEVVRSLRGDARRCLAYFRGARGAKVISNPDWMEIRSRFDEAVKESGEGPVRWVEILSPDITAPLVEGTQTYQSADLRQLGAVLRSMDLFICADTGPLHLADAANARCVGLYNITNPLHYGCLNAHSINVTDIDSLDASAIVSGLLID